jgi:hypothetical protein
LPPRRRPRRSATSRATQVTNPSNSSFNLSITSFV